MIINIAGTSGAGKSHLIRDFMRWATKYGKPQPVYVEGRGAPMGYDIPLGKDRWPIHLVGYYGDAGTGGCDTIRDVVSVFSWIEEQSEAAYVLYEGLFVMNMTRGPQLAVAMIEQGLDFYVLRLTTPLTTCFASINSRRAQRGEGALQNKKNTENNYIRAKNYCVKMRDVGATVIPVEREEALEVLKCLVLDK